MYVCMYLCVHHWYGGVLGNGTICSRICVLYGLVVAWELILYCVEELKELCLFPKVVSGETVYVRVYVSSCKSNVSSILIAYSIAHHT